MDGAPSPQAQQPLAHNATYITGTATGPRTEKISSFGTVSLGEVWPGIRVELRSANNNVEKIFFVAPRRDVAQIRIAMQGAESLRVAVDGTLIAATGFGPVQFAAPVAFQEISNNGAMERVAVPVRYQVEGRHYGFTVGNYDRTRPLVIDPVVQATYLGTDSTSGSSAPEAVEDIKIHPTTGNVYVVGNALGAGFPGTTGGSQASFGGSVSDAYVARLSADLRTVIQATYLGGSSADTGYGLHVSATDA